MRVALALAAAAGPAHAGPSLEQAIARHRAFIDTERGRDDAFALLAPPRDGIAPVLGGPGDEIPHLVEPVLAGRGGMRLVASVPARSRGTPPALRLGVNWREGAGRRTSLDGSLLSARAGAGAAYASVEPRHWGPGWTGSLILDAAAPALGAFGWRKTEATAFETPWLAWLGPWNADVFAGQLAGHDEPARPLLIGMRLQVRPLPGLELGASRVLQWGGRGRDRSPRSLLRGLAGRDNGGVSPDDPGNQLAGFDLRYAFRAGPGHGALYGQMIGEDEAGGMPSSWLALFGADWTLRRRATDWRVYVEWADLTAGSAFGRPRPGVAYRHHVYRAGYTHDGLPLGHPVGGDVRLASAGMLADAGRVSALAAVHAGRAAPTAQRFEPGARLAGLNAAASLEVEPSSRVGASMWVWRAGDRTRSALQAWWHTAWR